MRYLLLLMAFVSSCTFALSDKYSMKTQSDVSVSTSALALPFRHDRSYLLVQNKGTDSVILKLGSVHSASEGIVIVVGGNYEPIRVPKDSVYLKATSGTQTVSIVEGVE